MPIDMQLKSIHGCGTGALSRAHKPALATTTVIAHPLWPRLSLVSLTCSSALPKAEAVVSCPDDRSAKQAGPSAPRDGPEMDMDGRGKLVMVELCFEEV
ncbi:hypothetical protein LI328DRAFT_131750 [Trichoderma asperelloides]|nr:hypothetical protein LI328DRAFT_131750 [Trichoderma asperelloides]